MAQVIAENLFKRYGKVEAVKNVSFDCRDKEFLAILGPSGAGKTTILRMIAGVEKVTGGRIYIDGQDVTNLSPEERNVAMVFEDYNLYPHMSVYENLAFPLRAKRTDPATIDQRVKAIAEMLRIDALLDRRPSELSGGQRQRVSLGRALARPANVYLLDEPLAHLDAKLRHSMRSELRRLCESLSSTIIYVTHDYREALAMADRVLVLKQGVLQQFGTPAEIYEHPANEFVAEFVGDPPMNLLSCDLSFRGGWLVAKLSDRSEVSVPADGLSGLKPGPAKLGIRPRYLRVSLTKPEEEALAARVYVIEPSGEEMVLTARVGSELVQALVDKDFAAEIDQPVWLIPQKEKLRFFTLGN